ncbi:hypothetical protein ACTWQB_00220 [Piscibacillus sp. B03]|uniref:hypothetical protein n=1 Tax=Piscibacillus sp. B03 TaxID=3457430 RepID=UPI003FCE3E58
MEWEEVEKVSREVEEGSLRVLSYTFSNDEKFITIPYSTEDNKTKEAIRMVRQAYNWDVQDEVVN